MRSIDSILEVVVPLLIALFGGVASTMSNNNVSWGGFCTSFVLSGFCGYLTLLLCFQFGITEHFIGVLCGLAGYLSREILDVLRRLMTKKLPELIKFISSW